MRWRFLLWILALGMMLTGCGRSSKAPAVELELWIADFNEDTIKLLNHKILPAFEKEHPGVKVNPQYIAWSHLDEKMTVSFAGGVSPDVFQVGAEYVGGIAYRGQAIVLDKYVQEWGQRDDFYPASLKTCIYNGHLYGLPYLSAPRGLLYRKSLLRKAGFDHPPRTWEELAQVAEALTKRDRKGQITFAGFDLRVGWQVFLEFLWENGGDVIDPSGKRCLLDRPEAIEALEFYKALYDKYRVCPKGGMPAVGGGRPTFAAGVAAMEFNNQFGIRAVQKFSPEMLSDVGVAVAPRRKRTVSSVWTDWLAISSQSKHPDLAWELMKFLLRPDNLAAYNETMFFIPPRRSCARAEFIRKNPQLRQFMILMDKYGKTLPPVPQWFEIRTGLQNAVSKALYGDKSCEQALKDYARELNELLQEQ